MPLYKRTPGGVWWVRIGRETRQSTGTKNRADAEEFELTLRNRLWRKKKLGDRSAIAFKDAADRWLASAWRGRKRKRTRDREILKWLLPRIGEDCISAVADPDALAELQKDGLAEGWSESTVDRMMRTIRAVLRLCWKRKEIDQPYVPMFGDPESEPRFLTQAQFHSLCAQLPDHLVLAARFAVTTLLRLNSQARLKWHQVDMEQRWVWIRGEVTKGGKPFGIYLSDEALSILQECRELWPVGDAVFQYRPAGKNKKSRPVGNFHKKAFKSAAKRAGVPGLRWHDLRHTGASWAVQNGITLQELMELGNWKSYRSVLIYAHLAKSNQTRAAQVVGTQVAHALKKSA